MEGRRSAPRAPGAVTPSETPGEEDDTVTGETEHDMIASYVASSDERASLE